MQIEALVAAGVLTSGQGEALTTNRKNNSGDAGKVQAFLSEVLAFLNAGILSVEQAASAVPRVSERYRSRPTALDALPA